MQDSSSTASPRSFAGRFRAALAGAALGGAIGLTAGALEGGATLYFSPLEFRAPLAELVWVEVCYGLAGAAYAALLAFALRSMTPRRAGAWTLGTLCLFVFATFAMKLVPAAADGASASSIASFAAAIVAAIAIGALFARVMLHPRPVAWLAATSIVAAHVVALLAGRGAPAALGVASAVSQAKPPNIVVILIDTLRADHLSCYGYARPTSPSIDALAKDGARFDAAYSAAPWTRPSVASLMTSLYPSSHDVYSQWRKLPAEVPTLAALLHGRGYRTAAFSANEQVSPTFGFGRGFDVFWNSRLPSLLGQTALGGWRRFLKDHVVRLLVARATSHAPSESWSLRGTDAAAVNRAVFDWIEDVSLAEPVFLYVHYLDPHHPYAAPEDLINDEPLDVLALNTVLDIPIKRAPYPLTSYEAPSPQALAGVTGLYDAEIRYCDRELGRLLERLRAKGLLDSAYVIVTADHGEELHDHGQWLHGNSLFDEVVRVPLVISGPGIAPQVVASPVSLVDVLPTVAYWSGAAVGFPIQGQSLVPLLAHEPAHGERAIYFERPEEPGLAGLRLGSQKLIRLEGPQGEIWMEFDLARDPHETNNLAAGAGGVATSELRARLLDARANAGRLLRQHAVEIELPNGVRETLQALGYVGD